MYQWFDLSGRDLNNGENRQVIVYAFSDSKATEAQVNETLIGLVNKGLLTGFHTRSSKSITWDTSQVIEFFRPPTPTEIAKWRKNKSKSKSMK